MSNKNNLYEYNYINKGQGKCLYKGDGFYVGIT